MSVSLADWGDGKTISCYVSTSYEDVKLYKIDIEEAKKLYPKLSKLQAIKQVARHRFKTENERGI